jgi:hypothetical protein
MLMHEDFALSCSELAAINQIVTEAVAKLHGAGEHASDGVEVIFGFSPFGRNLEVRVDGTFPVPLPCCATGCLVP